MGIQVNGKLHTVFETKKVSERFQKREFVLELSDGKYPQLVIFQLTGDRCEQLDRVTVGDEVRLDFSLRGREWRSPQGEVKYFNSLDVWTIEAARSSRRPDARGETRDDGRAEPRQSRDSGYARGGDEPPPRTDADAPAYRDSRDSEDIPF